MNRVELLQLFSIPGWHTYTITNMTMMPSLPCTVHKMKGKGDVTTAMQTTYHSAFCLVAKPARAA